MRGTVAALAALLLAAALPVAAGTATPLWGFVDGTGVAHVASHRLDPRYRPLLGDAAPERVPGKADSTSGLLTWLEIAPEVRVLLGEMAAAVPLRCFEYQPSVTSSLKVLRKTPWARTRVEELYVRHMRHR